jgi:hypothetical protein
MPWAERDVVTGRGPGMRAHLSGARTSCAAPQTCPCAAPPRRCAPPKTCANRPIRQGQIRPLADRPRRLDHGGVARGQRELFAQLPHHCTACTNVFAVNSAVTVGSGWRAPQE